MHHFHSWKHRSWLKVIVFWFVMSGAIRDEGAVHRAGEEALRQVVEITEDFVLGIAPPIYHYESSNSQKCGKKQDAQNRNQKSDDVDQSSRRKFAVCKQESSLCEFEENIFEDLEL